MALRQIMMASGWMTGFIDTSFTISLNHNQLQQLTINDCLRLAPF
jgi:hypothetical protein